MIEGNWKQQLLFLLSFGLVIIYTAGTLVQSSELPWKLILVTGISFFALFGPLALILQKKLSEDIVQKMEYVSIAVGVSIISSMYFLTSNVVFHSVIFAGSIGSVAAYLLGQNLWDNSSRMELSN
jgi:hypothetical protein